MTTAILMAIVFCGLGQYLALSAPSCAAVSNHTSRMPGSYLSAGERSDWSMQHAELREGSLTRGCDDFWQRRDLFLIDDERKRVYIPYQETSVSFLSCASSVAAENTCTGLSTLMYLQRIHYHYVAGIDTQPTQT